MPVYGRIIFVEQLYPISVSHFSRTLTIVVGFFLLYLARGIYLRKERSWYFSVVFTFLSILFHLIKGFDFEEAIILLLVLFLLIKTKKYFTVKSSRIGLEKRIKISLFILIILFIYSTLGFFVLQGQFRSDVNIKNIAADYVFTITGEGRDTLIPATKHAKWFEDSIFIIGILSILLFLFTIFGPFDDLTKPSEEDKLAAKLIEEKYYVGSFAAFLTSPDKSLFFDNNKMAYISYKVAGDVSVALGEPAGNSLYFEDCIKQYLTYLKQLGLTACFYSIGDQYKYLLNNYHFKFISIGEEALVMTSDFDLTSPRLKNLRYSLNKIRKVGYVFKWSAISDIKLSDLNKIDVLYQKWITSKKLSKMKFSLNYYPFSPDMEGEVLMLYDDTQKLLSVLSFYPYSKGKKVSLDLMIRNILSPSGTVEASLADSILHFKQQNIEEVNLGMAPFSMFINEKEKPNPLKKAFIKNINRFYKAASLYKFKEQFDPKWEIKYVAYQNDIDLPKIALSLLSVHLRN
jgi:phosphatidylglycerol lysyltransferase